MTPGEFREIVKTMKEFGLIHVKMNGLELSMGAVPGVAAVPALNIIPPDAPSDPIEPIKHKVEELSSLLKLSDVELVDQLFPEPKEPEEESA